MKKIIEINDVNPLILSGPNDENIKLIESNFKSLIVLRGNTINLDGNKKEIDVLSKMFHEMELIAAKKNHVSKSDVNTLINFLNSEDYDNMVDSTDEVVILNSHKGSISAKTKGQKKYFKAILKNDIVFAIGPAGTGKTYQAVASAVSSLKRKEVSKIVITRPAVEAGERLGFLPGDMREKVDPYLRPLYDSLYDLLDFEKIQKKIEVGDIEIAPLAFMRGRTLKNSFAILDEAQNATDTQIKMFLTRIGENSKIVINGDPSQIDLPNKQLSGLNRSKKLLEHLKEISVIDFNHTDVVRHPLVSKIVKAYADQKTD